MRKRLPLLTMAVCSALLISACSSQKTSGVETEKTAISVEVASASKESLDAISSLSGTLEPYEETVVSFEVGGRIQKMKAKIGDTIQTGTILTNLDPTSFQLQVEQANNAILQAEASLNASDSAIHSAEANVNAANARINSTQASLAELDKGAREQEKAQARLAVERAKDAYNKVKTDLNRIKALYDQGITSKKEYEDMQLQVTNAEKDVANAEQTLSLIIEGATAEQRNQVVAGINEAQAGKEQAQAGVGQSVASKGQAQASYDLALIGKEQAELTLSKTNLTSPLTGVVLEKLVSEGQQINPGDHVYKLGRTDQLKVLLPVPDMDIKVWKVGDEVSVTLYDQEKKGTVNKIYPQTNAGTGTISVEVVVPNKELDWIPGQVVKANKIMSDNNGILVPIAAVLSNGADPYVFKAVKGKAVKTKVETGNLVNNKIHIVSGLKDGDQVVIRGGELLLDGDPLQTDGGKKE